MSCIIPSPLGGIGRQAGFLFLGGGNALLFGGELPSFGALFLGENILG